MKWLVYLSKFIVLWSSGIQWCWQAYRSTAIIVAAYMYKNIWTSAYCKVLPTIFTPTQHPTNASCCGSSAHLELHWVMWTGLSSWGMNYSPCDTKQGQPGQPNKIRCDNGIKVANFPKCCESTRILLTLCNVASPSCAINSLTNSNNKYIKIQIKNVAKIWQTFRLLHFVPVHAPAHDVHDMWPNPYHVANLEHEE